MQIKIVNNLELQLKLVLNFSSYRDSKNCRRSLERYEQACSVDSDTKTCAGTYTACREAMVEILGKI